MHKLLSVFVSFLIIFVVCSHKVYAGTTFSAGADAGYLSGFTSYKIGGVEYGGKGPMDRLYRIFNGGSCKSPKLPFDKLRVNGSRVEIIVFSPFVVSLSNHKKDFCKRLPCYMIFDFDSGNSDSNIINKSKELLAPACEDQAQPQSLFIAENVACFPRTWESDLKSEIPDAEVLASEGRKELGLGDDTGKPLIARYIARKLTARTPAVVPPSLKTIIEKAVTVTWNKSCLQASTATSLPVIAEARGNGRA